jgi:hypothetical protein
MRSALLLGALLSLSACSVSHAVAPASAPAAAAAADRQVIQTASMHLVRDAPEEGVKRAEGLAVRVGGYVRASSSEALTMMVPSARLEEVMDELATLGQVERREVRAQDVTQEQADLQLRLENLRKARARYLELLDRATSVAETLAVEKELERITLEIERVQAALERVKHLVQLATLDVRFDRPVRPGPVGWVFYGVFSAIKWLFVWS